MATQHGVNSIANSLYVIHRQWLSQWPTFSQSRSHYHEYGHTIKTNLHFVIPMSLLYSYKTYEGETILCELSLFVAQIESYYDLQG